MPAERYGPTSVLRLANSQRYHRQMLLADFASRGSAGFRHRTRRVLGCGRSLASVASEQLVRPASDASPSTDRDASPVTNLQRQDPLRRAATPVKERRRPSLRAERLRLVNSSIQIEFIVADVRPGNTIAVAESCGVGRLRTAGMLPST